jgi:hypothetical protein
MAERSARSRVILHVRSHLSCDTTRRCKQESQKRQRAEQFAFVEHRINRLNYPKCFGWKCRKRKAFVTTDTELKAIAPPAIIGLSSQPNTG